MWSFIVNIHVSTYDTHPESNRPMSKVYFSFAISLLRMKQSDFLQLFSANML
jgi:hypothetical protein